ncbi:MAG: DUF1501 domain-containing protein [Verrucomicrobiales bacterium]
MTRADRAALLTRRQFFGRGAKGIGAVALASLLDRDAFSATSRATEAGASGGFPGLPHWFPRVKRVIYLLQNGAPSHVDLFDHKPGLARLHGTPLPDSVRNNQRLSTMTAGQGQYFVQTNIAPFKKCGQSGATVSDLLPHTQGIADQLCFIKSMHTNAINHAPAITHFLTGSEMPGRPSMGAWLSYGLGSESENLPAFVVMTSRDKEASCGQIFYDFYWSSGFLPSKFQGVKFRGQGDPVLYLSNPSGMSREIRRGLLDDLAQLNRLHHEEFRDPEILTRIAQYEMAYRMQMSVPELTDFSNEPPHILEMYGPDVSRPGSYAYNCLIARRLAERGVRFVQLMHAGWDQHQNLFTQLEVQCRDTDQPSAALVRDLAQRGLLDDTLVIWGGEFGRTVFRQGNFKPEEKKGGRDHHPRCFTIWMAGGGIKPGLSFGATDDYAYNIVRDPVDVHDWQATVMHLLGIDHEKFTYSFQGRQYRLTDVHGKVVEALLV